MENCFLCLRLTLFFIQKDVRLHNCQSIDSVPDYVEEILYLKISSEEIKDAEY